MESFDWTKHMHDRLGNTLIRLVSLKGQSLEDFGLMHKEHNKGADLEAIKDIRIDIRINGVEVSFADFVEACYSIDNRVLEAAAKDVLDKQFGDSLRSVEEMVSKLREAFEGELVQRLMPEWDRIVREGPKEPESRARHVSPGFITVSVDEEDRLG